MITLTLPISQEDIPSKIKEINKEVDRIKSEEKQILLLKKAVQDNCSHPKTYSDGGGYGGPAYSSTYCEVCEKSW